MPKVTFIKDGKETTVEFEHGKLPYSHHGLPESFLDVAMNCDIPLEAVAVPARRAICSSARARRISASSRTTSWIVSTLPGICGRSPVSAARP
jgi:hypothetical protein